LAITEGRVGDEKMGKGQGGGAMDLSLLARRPRLRDPSTSFPLLPATVRGDYPALAEDLEVLERELTPAFSRYDIQALRDQNRYRRQQVLLLLGAAVVTALGGVQAALADARWPGVALTVVGVLLATSSRWAGEQESLDGYLSARVKAERLRALYFRYLSRTGPYAGADREAALRRAVVAVRAGKEPE
jgi:hypothetical protein